MIFFETFRDLWRLLGKRERLIALILVGLLIITGALEIAGMFFLFGYISVLGAGTVGNVGPTFVNQIYIAIAGAYSGAQFAFVAGVVLVAAFALKNAFWLLSSFGMLRFSMKRYEWAAGELFDGYQEMPLELMRGRGTAEPVQTLNNVLTVFKWAFTPVLQAMADIVIILAMLIALMLVIDPVLVIEAGLVLGVTAATFLFVTRRLSESLGERMITAQKALYAVTGESLRGILEVRLAGRQSVMRERFSEVAGEFALTDRRIRALDMTPRAINEMVLTGGIAFAAIWFASSKGGLAGALPTLAILGFAGLRVTAAMARLTQYLQQMRQTRDARVKMMAAIARSAPSILAGYSGDESKAETYREEDFPLPANASVSLSKEISVENVSFTYPGAANPAVDNVSLTIPAGSFTAFCGPSGGGKSTLALLVMGLLRPQTGNITCDGWDTQRHISAWHLQIGHVGQAPFMAPRSVRENVAFGLRSEDIDDAAVWSALEAAAVAEHFRNHPEGLSAMLGEEAALLSGGQRQRVAIARALYNQPAVLVFDEATAALDTVTERDVTAAINRLRGERTVIAIAHRLSTIEMADMIHLVEYGKITASGTYDELIGKAPGFRDLAGATA